MKVVSCLAVAVLAASLSGCATDTRLVAADSTEESKYDLEYMARVEQASRGRGVTVKWLNPPEKKKQPEQARPD
jgi:hypothetical protein